MVVGAVTPPLGTVRLADPGACAVPVGVAVGVNTGQPAVGSERRVETALVVGVGPGLGYALARTLAAAGMQVALASRNAERLDTLVDQVRAASGLAVRAYGCDAINERSVQSLMSQVSADQGVPDLVIYAMQSFGPGRAIDIEVPAFEKGWRQNCLGGFIVAREAARCMLPHKRGMVVLVGSTSGLLGRADHLNLAVGKFGLRAISQVMARELWPEGIHGVHCVIDADDQEDAEAMGYPQVPAPGHCGTDRHAAPPAAELLVQRDQCMALEQALLGALLTRRCVRCRRVRPHRRQVWFRPSPSVRP